MAPITPDDLRKSKWSQTAHLDGSDKGGRFFVNIHQCVDHPRVTGSRQQWRRRDLEPVVTYQVDGAEVGSLELAAEALNRAFTVGTPEDRDD